MFEELQLALIQNFMARLQKLPNVTSQFIVQDNVMYFRIRSKSGNIIDYRVEKDNNKYELKERVIMVQGKPVYNIDKWDDIKATGPYNEKKLIKYLDKQNNN